MRIDINYLNLIFSIIDNNQKMNWESSSHLPSQLTWKDNRNFQLYSIGCVWIC